jgi:molecular chaperone DnaK
MAANFVEGQTVGIDLGTTYSSIAQLDDEGNPRLIKNVDGRDITPSVVLLGDGDRVVVGPSFARIAEETPDRIIEAIKREMGNKDFHVVFKDQKLTPEFVSALILKKLRQDAEKEIGPIGNAVITVPYYFNDIRRKATQDAGRIAGLNVVDIINEPTAATLSHAWEKGELGRADLEQVERTILVYDLGGGTFDVTVVRYTPTNFKVLATDGDVMLGGLDWSRRLVDHVAEEFQKKFDSDPREDPTGLRQLTQDCEDAKRKLSETAQVPIEVYFQGNSMTVSVTRGEFENLTSDLLQRTRDTTELVLAQAEVGPGDLDELVLVGGSTHMPVVEKMLKEICQREPNKEVDPEEAVGHGAALHAAILEARATGGETRMGKAIINRLRAVATADVNSHSLGTKVTDPADRKKKNHIMIQRNTELPFDVTQRFATTSDNQQRIHVTVLEGEVSDIDACANIGDFWITNLPANLPKGSPVEVTYAYDASGRINCTARELTSNNAASIEIVRDSGLDDEGVDTFGALAESYQVE